MIFLSHNSKDKPMVEPIALRLNQVFGQSNVFYDSWSIQPGDGIIDKMNSGLENCRYFFLFVSRNSLESNMVKLEWQNALIKFVKGDLKIVPVRLDASLLPSVLTQTLYLDIYTNGIEVVLKQMVDVIKGSNTFIPQFSEFSNLRAIITQFKKGFHVDIEAVFFMEPRSHYIVLLQNEQNEMAVDIIGGGMCQCGFNPNLVLNNGLEGNGWYIGVSQATIPGFPFELSITQKAVAPIKLIAILHEESKNNWRSMPIIYKQVLS